MSTPALRRVLRRESHSPRTVAMVIAVALMILVLAYLGTEIVLSLLAQPALLLAPDAQARFLIGLPTERPGWIIVLAGAVDEVWGPVVGALRLAAGALWDVEILPPSDSARGAVETALLRAWVGADGSVKLPFDVPLEGREFDSLAGFDALFPALVTLPAEQGRRLFSPFGQTLLDTAAAGQPYAGPPDLPAAADRTNCGLVPCVAVTFDDGPGPNTPAVLDALAQADSSATFFVLGPAAERSPETLKRAYAEGHTIGTHTWSHAELTGLTDEKIVEEVERTQRAVAAITGQTPAYFRPPYGALNERVTGKLAELGLPAVLWDVDSADWQGPPAAVLVDNAVSPAKDGWSSKP